LGTEHLAAYDGRARQSCTARHKWHAGASGQVMATKDVDDADAGKLKVASSGGRRWHRRGRVRLSASSHRVEKRRVRVLVSQVVGDR
jgi:hypothetical protein